MDSLPHPMDERVCSWGWVHLTRLVAVFLHQSEFNSMDERINPLNAFNPPPPIDRDLHAMRHLGQNNIYIYIYT